MGIYKTLEAVPTQHRLEQYATRYEDTEPWDQFVAATAEQFDSAHYRQTFDKTGRSWQAHMAARPRHYALAVPRDIQTWVRTLSETRTQQTVYKEYFVRLEEFYDWLKYHVDHPHIYSPVLMAVVADSTTRAVWDQKFNSRGGGEADA